MQPLCFALLLLQLYLMSLKILIGLMLSFIRYSLVSEHFRTMLKVCFQTSGTLWFLLWLGKMNEMGAI